MTICKGDEQQRLSAESLTSGFRKCGIVPLDRKPILNRLPYEPTCDTAEVSDGSRVVHENMSDSVVKVLKEMRYSSQTEHACTHQGR